MWSTPRPDCFTLWKGPVHTAQEAGWAPGPVWKGAENLASTGIRSSDRPARTESLPAHSMTMDTGENTELTFQEINPVPIEQEAGWVTKPVWTLWAK